MVKVYTFRGATHLLTVASAGAYLALRASGRQWELPSWDRDLRPGRCRLAGVQRGGPRRRRPRSRSHPRRACPRARSAERHYRLAAAGLTNGSDTLLKPLMWQGDLCFGPARDGIATLRRLDTVPGWAGLPDVDEAGRRAVSAYFRTYGPASPDRLHYWLGEGRARAARPSAGGSTT